MGRRAVTNIFDFSKLKYNYGSSAEFVGTAPANPVDFKGLKFLRKIVHPVSLSDMMGFNHKIHPDNGRRETIEDYLKSHSSAKGFCLWKNPLA